MTDRMDLIAAAVREDVEPLLMWLTAHGQHGMAGLLHRWVGDALALASQRNEARAERDALAARLAAAEAELARAREARERIRDLHERWMGHIGRAALAQALALLPTPGTPDDQP